VGGPALRYHGSMLANRLSRPALLLAVTALAASAAALAGGGREPDDAIHACAHEKNGKLRAVGGPQFCHKDELPLVWSVQGPKGDPGDSGPVGPKGDSGTILESVDQLSGLSCKDGTVQGSTRIELTAEHEIVIRCVLIGEPVHAPSLRVNELMTGASGSATGEFVEIVNSGTLAADVGGFRLVYRSATGTSDSVLATIPSGTTLDAGARYLFAGSGYTGAAPPNQSFSTGLAATAGGIGLRNAQGALLDSVGYGSTAANGFVERFPAPAPPTAVRPGASLSRVPDGHDTDDNSVDFSVTAPTPGAPN
jgi:hypothetical protein